MRRYRSPIQRVKLQLHLLLLARQFCEPLVNQLAVGHRNVVEQVARGALKLLKSFLEIRAGVLGLLHFNAKLVMHRLLQTAPSILAGEAPVIRANGVGDRALKRNLCNLAKLADASSVANVPATGV